MATPKTTLHRWIGEFCAPVVVTVTSAEVEKICLKNGLLFHDLLSAFSHLDSVSSTIRTNGSNISVKEGHIRFESSSEVFPKSSANIEEACLNYFEQYDLESLPMTVDELKSNPPSALTSTLENVILRSGSFQDFDMLSHPIIIMSVVSSSEPHPLQKLQELAHQHQFIPGISLGLYEPEISRIYVLLHDIADTPDSINPDELFSQMKTTYPYHAKLLRMNSLSASSPNLQQPDWWSRWILPKFFINQTAGYEESPTLINPDTGAIVLGSRLGMEDFMLLREFVVELFEKDIVPALERRLTLLNRAVSDSKKGMKNVFKNFWRKPREDTPPTSPGRGESGVAMKLNVRYKYDRPEMQTLYLADLSFALKDYETAASLYRLVKDDFKSDKSVLHHAQCTLNLAASLCLQDSGKQTNIREVHHQLENLTAILSQPFEPVHMHAYFSILMADLYTLTRSPIDSTQTLILATEHLLPKGMPLLGALLREKTSQYFLVAGQARKLAFNQVLAGLDFYNIGGKALKQSTVCFAAAAILFESGPWGEIKLKLFKALVSEFKCRGLDGAKRCLLLQFRILDTIASDVVDAKGHVPSAEAVNVLREIIGGNEEWHGSLGIDALKTSHVVLKDGWRTCDIRCVLVGDIPLELRERTQSEILVENDGIPNSVIEVSSLVIPNIDVQTSTFLYPLNGSKTAVTSVLPSTIPCSTLVGCSHSGSLEVCGGIRCCSNYDLMLSEYFRIVLDEEKSWVADQVETGDKNKNSGDVVVKESSQQNLDNLAQVPDTLAEQIAIVEYDIENGMGAINGRMRSGGDDFTISVGEDVRVKFKVTNNLPIHLSVKKITIEAEVKGADGNYVSDDTAYTSQTVNLDLVPHEDANVVLSFKPNREGTFQIVRAKWSLNEQSLDSTCNSTSGLTLVGQKSLLKRGSLLQKSLKQRAERTRAPGSYLKVCVGPPQPILQLSLDLGQNNNDEGIVLLQGQFQHGELIIKNEGGAPACDLDMIISGTYLAIEREVNGSIEAGTTNPSSSRYMSSIGPSGLSYRFPSSVKVAPGETRRFRVCVRLEQGGRQSVSMFMGYSKPGEPASSRRDSFVSFDFYVCASLTLSARISPHPSDVSKRIVIIDLRSYLDPDDLNEGGHGEKTNTEALYIAESKDTNTLLEGQIKVESLALIGVLEAAEMTSKMNNVIHPSEKLSIFLEAGVISSPVKGSNKFDLGSATTWILPNPIPDNATTTNATSQLNYTSGTHLPELQEYFTCLETSGRKYTSDLQMARDAKRKEMANADQEGPRSIAAVRRENREENKSDQRSVLSDEETKEQERISHKLWVPKTFSDMALLEKDHGKLGGAISGGSCLLVSWIARWRGCTRRGVQILHDIPALASAPISVTEKPINNSYLGVDNSAPRSRAMSITDGGNVTSQNMDKYLSVSVNGPKRTTIPAGSRSCIAGVTVDIISTSPSPLKFSIEALEKGSIASSHSSSSSSSADNNDSGFQKHMDSKGIKWLGKTKFSNIIIDPFSSMKIDFSASLSKCGIFDLNRFQVTVQGMCDKKIDAEEGTGSVIQKNVLGSCYVEVMKQ